MRRIPCPPLVLIAAKLLIAAMSAQAIAAAGDRGHFETLRNDAEVRTIVLRDFPSAIDWQGVRAAVLRFDRPAGSRMPAFGRAFQDALTEWEPIEAAVFVERRARSALSRPSREALLASAAQAARAAGCGMAVAGRVELFRQRLAPEPKKRGLDLELRIWLLRVEADQVRVVRHERKLASWRGAVDARYAAIWIAEETLANWFARTEPVERADDGTAAPPRSR